MHWRLAARYLGSTTVAYNVKNNLDFLFFMVSHFGFISSIYLKIFIDLEEKLKECGDARQRLIVTDGVFSMDGNVAPLPQICDLAEKYKAMVFIDECHATGFFGVTGR